jgi:hypothetical protein
MTVTRRLIDLSNVLPAQSILTEAEGKLAEITALMDNLKGIKSSERSERPGRS